MKIFFILLSLCIATTAVAEPVRVKVIELHYKEAREVLPLVKSILAPAGRASGQGRKLLIKTNLKNLTEIRYLIQNFDKAPRNLRLSISGDNFREHGVTNTILQTTARHTDKDKQTIRILEGHKAFIETGKEVPVVSTAPVGNDGLGVTYKPIVQGFFVTPTLMHNNQVKLVIGQFKKNRARLGGGEFDTERVESVMTVPLSQWVKIAGTEQDYQDTHSNSRRYHTVNRYRHGQHDIYLRVEITN